MGDIFDYWFEYKRVVPRGYTRVLGKIASLTDSGIPVHFFTGNHDIWVFDYLPAETGVILHKEPFRTELGGKKFFLAHGDGLDATDKGYILLKRYLPANYFSGFMPGFILTSRSAWLTDGRKTAGSPKRWVARRSWPKKRVFTNSPCRSWNRNQSTILYLDTGTGLPTYQSEQKAVLYCWENG